MSVDKLRAGGPLGGRDTSASQLASIQHGSVTKAYKESCRMSLPEMVHAANHGKLTRLPYERLQSLYLGGPKEP
jgi:hypothetical protein